MLRGRKALVGVDDDGRDILLGRGQEGHSRGDVREQGLRARLWYPGAARCRGEAAIRAIRRVTRAICGVDAGRAVHDGALRAAATTRTARSPRPWTRVHREGRKPSPLVEDRWPALHDCAAHVHEPHTHVPREAVASTAGSSALAARRAPTSPRPESARPAAALTTASRRPAVGQFIHQRRRGNSRELTSDSTTGWSLGARGDDPWPRPAGPRRPRSPRIQWPPRRRLRLTISYPPRRPASANRSLIRSALTPLAEVSR